MRLKLLGNMGAMGLSPDAQNCAFCMRRKSLERFPRNRRQRKLLVNDHSIHHDSCVTHVSWCMSGSLTHGARENVPGIPGACATRNVTYLARSPWLGCVSHAIRKLTKVISFTSYGQHFIFHEIQYHLGVIFIHKSIGCIDVAIVNFQPLIHNGLS